jgi:NhaP-type Na+/H+ or K+/H+ antiporter
MIGVLVFAAVLLLAVLVSARANRGVLSTAALFLVAGIVLGSEPLDLVPIGAEDPFVEGLAELALFAVLFTDGMRIGVRELADAWRLPGRALLVGMPLTLALTAVLAHFVAGLGWGEAFLVGAALSPTDPVFAAALVGREEVPYRLRRLLNVESGVNDGLALPVVVLLLPVVGAEAEIGLALGELALGVAVGVIVPQVAIRLERSRLFSASVTYLPLNAFAIGALVYALSTVVHANLFLAAFSAGVTTASLSSHVRHAFEEFGELVAELLKLAALLTFGLLISVEFLGEITVSGYVFAVLALVLVRPIALGVALAGASLGRREWAAAAWFGPKGFASVVLGLVILQAGVPNGDQLFHLIALVTAASMLAHSSTDVVLARRFRRGKPAADAPAAGQGSADAPRRT